jgi:hypothetical protein
MLLPGSDNFDVLLQAGDREVVQFGLMKGETMHTALSGAEWARVTAAMASAAVPKGQFAVIIPEERAFDPDTLKEVMESMTACPHQVIITSPIAPSSLCAVMSTTVCMKFSSNMSGAAASKPPVATRI